MKNLIKSLLIVFFTTTTLWSCKEEKDELLMIAPVSTPEIIAPATGASYVLNVLDKNKTVVTFIYKAATYDQSTIVNYMVEMVKSGESFDKKDVKIQTFGPTTATYLPITTTNLNDAVKALGLVKDNAGSVDVRIVSYVGTDMSLKQYSKTITLVVTPYTAGPVYTYKDLYLVGDATAGGWDNLATNGNMYPLLKNLDTPSKYSYTGFFKAGEFKMVEVKGKWDIQLGKGASDGLLSTDGGSGNIKITTAGYYTLTVDKTALTYKLVPFTETTTYDKIGVIGTATVGGWTTDTQMTKSTHDPHVWLLKNTTLVEGEIKFRANQEWKTSWGEATAFFGTGTLGGPNIPLAIGWKYDIYFNDLTGAYTYIPVFE